MKYLIKKMTANRLIRFFISGGFNALFSYSCFAVLMCFIRNKEVAVTLNLLISIFFNYNMSARFVFREEKMSMNQIIKFYAVYFLTYPVNLFHLYITVDLLHWNVYLAQLATFLYLPFISYYLQKKLIFSINKKENME